MKRILKSLLPRFILNKLRSLSRRLAAHQYRRVLRDFPRRLVEHSYGGHQLKVMLADPDGAVWYDRDWPKLPEISLLSTARLRCGATVFNLGAHQGVVAMILSAEVGASGKVIAVDPQELNTELIATNAKLNGFTQLVAVRAALADRPGSVKFGVNLNDRVQLDSTTDSGTVVVAVTVDQLTLEYGQPDAIFIDVEGFECSVLTGAKETFSSGSCDWFVEVHVNAGLEVFGKTATNVLEFFPPDRFDRFAASESEREFVPLADAAHLMTNRFFLVALER
jgi:FkbM family methyltransferase